MKGAWEIGFWIGVVVVVVIVIMLVLAGVIASALVWICDENARSGGRDMHN